MVNNSQERIGNQEIIKSLRNHVFHITNDRTTLQNQRDELRQELQRMEQKSIHLEQENIQLGEAIQNLTATVNRLTCENQQHKERLKLIDAVVSELGAVAFKEWNETTQRIRNEQINIAASKKNLRKANRRNSR